MHKYYYCHNPRVPTSGVFIRGFPPNKKTTRQGHPYKLSVGVPFMGTLRSTLITNIYRLVQVSNPTLISSFRHLDRPTFVILNQKVERLLTANLVLDTTGLNPH
jgi:hypothetical protein